MEIKDLKEKLVKLTAQEIQELKVEEAQRIVAGNTNILVDIEKFLFDEIGEHGKHEILIDQLKSLKTMIIEQNRALKTVIQNG